MSWGYLVWFERGCGCRTLAAVTGEVDDAPDGPAALEAIACVGSDPEIAPLLYADHDCHDGLNLTIRARYCPDIVSAEKAERARWDKESAERAERISVTDAPTTKEDEDGPEAEA